MSKRKLKAELPDDDPFAHLTAVERFARAIKRRDALVRDGQTAALHSGDAARRIHNSDGRETVTTHHIRDSEVGS